MPWYDCNNSLSDWPFWWHNPQAMFGRILASFFPLTSLFQWNLGQKICFFRMSSHVVWVRVPLFLQGRLLGGAVAIALTMLMCCSVGSPLDVSMRCFVDIKCSLSPTEIVMFYVEAPGNPKFGSLDVTGWVFCMSWRLDNVSARFLGYVDLCLQHWSVDNGQWTLNSRHWRSALQ